MIEGKGPAFHMDMRHCDREELAYLQYVLMPGDKATCLDYAEQRGIDFAKYPMEVELSEIELSGMLQTGDNLETTVGGLYNGCVFYSFSGSMCSGYVAALEAAGAGRGIDDSREIDPEEVARERERIFKPLKRDDGIGYERFERAIRQVMAYYMGFVRNQKGMETALQRLDFIAQHIDQLQASDYRELMRTNEAIHLLKTCRLSTLATMERKESGRAIYRRSDFPDRSDEFNGTLALWEENGKTRCSWSGKGE